MKTTTLLSLVAATVLFTACGEDTKKTVTDAATSVSDSVKETATKAVDATKEAADAAADKAAEVAKAAADKAAEVKAAAEKKAEEVAKAAAEAKEAAAKKAADAAEALKEKAAETTAAVKEAVTPDNAAGKAAFAKCAGCHGVDGKTKALGKSAVIAGQDAATLEASINGYKAGTRNISGMGMLMKGQVGSMDDATVKAVAAYISGL